MIAYPLQLGSVQTRVLDAGTSDRHVLFLHGAGARADRWAPTLTRFAALGYRCVAIDFPGHGFASKGTTPDYSVPGFADLIPIVIERLGLSRPAIVGTSMGGHVAAVHAVRRPETVRGLALVGAVGLTPLTPEQEQLIALSLTATTREQVAMKLRIVLRDQRLVTEALIEEEWRINTSCGASEGFAALADYWRTRHAGDLIGETLARGQAGRPITLIWGAEDRSTPLAMGEAAAALLTNGALSVLPGGGHAPYLDVPDAFDAALKPFLAALDWDTAS